MTFPIVFKWACLIRSYNGLWAFMSIRQFVLLFASLNLHCQRIQLWIDMVCLVQEIDHFSFLYVIIVTYGSTYLNIIRIPWGQYISFFRWEGGLLQFLTQWFYFLYKYHDDITSTSHTQRPWSIKTSLAKGSWTEVLSESSSRSLCPTYSMAISSQIISDLYSSHWLLYHQTITNVV